MEGICDMKVEQFVMAYGVEQDRLRALLPEGFESLRPVLRINGEIREGDPESVYIELNTAVEACGKRGWLNIGCWDSGSSELCYQRKGKSVTFEMPFLTITYTGVGVEGGCPAEKDNDGCFFFGERLTLRPPEQIEEKKEFCDCTFAWKFAEGGAHGASIGKTLPAVSSAPKTHYAKQAFSVSNAAVIPCEQVLGAYVVRFER